jgi:LPS sulfotransferase NodH
MWNIRSEIERRYKERLRSTEWDVGNGTAPRLKFAVLSLPRTGSEWLCAALRRRGIGVPLEYLTALEVAQRMGCADQAGNIRLSEYMAQLQAKRTTPNGVFGLKLHPLHLKAVSSGDEQQAAESLNWFDRIFFLRRRDRLSQAISLARAVLTGQYHVVPGDAPLPLTQTDDTLFREIATQLARILSDEDYIQRVMALVDPLKVTALWYEDLSDATIAALAAGLAPDDRAAAEATEDGLPRQGDTNEALAIKRRFLGYVSGEAS